VNAPEIRVLEDQEEVAREAAELFVWLGNQPQAQRGMFRVCLSGGSTPKQLYETLAAPSCAKQLDWGRVECYFGDERCVPADDPRSNFAMANAALFRPLRLAGDRIFRMRGEARPDEAAMEYEKLLRERVKGETPGGVRFTLVLLGLGEDAHVASLFPGGPELAESRRAVIPSLAPVEPRQRLTLTVPILNEAEAVMFLVSGSAKAEAVRKALEGPTDDRQVPASFIRPRTGRLIWLLDRPAASSLRLSKQTIVSHEE